MGLRKFKENVGVKIEVKRDHQNSKNIEACSCFLSMLPKEGR